MQIPAWIGVSCREIFIKKFPVRSFGDYRKNALKVNYATFGQRKCLCLVKFFYIDVIICIKPCFVHPDVDEIFAFASQPEKSYENNPEIWIENTKLDVADKMFICLYATVSCC